MSKKIDEIHDALLGTYQEKGIVSKVREHDVTIARLLCGLAVATGALITGAVKFIFFSSRG
jgi:hypothetical protein